MSRKPPRFYVFHGEDEFSLRAQLNAMREQMGDRSMADLNASVIDGKAASAPDVISAVSAMPFLSEKRLVIVEGMLSWLSRKNAGKTGKDQLTLLAEELPHLPDFARLVFAEPQTLSERNAVLKLAKNDPGGYHKEFNAPKDATSWIKSRVRDTYEAAIDHQAAAALAAVVGNDLRAADSELSNLVAYVDGERSISEADVAQMTSYVAEANVFEMVDALGRRDGPTATRLLHRLLDDDDPLRLFGMMVRQFRLLLLAREYLNEGGTPKQIGSAIGVHPYVGEKIGQQVRAFTLEDLEKIYRYLLETDSGIKTGKVDGVVALDLLIAGISS